jgi:hypothetical protein
MTEVLSAAGPTIRPLPTEPTEPTATDRPATRPLTAVLAAIELGSASLAEVARATGLRHDVVEAAVDRLVWMGRLTTEELSFGCPPSGCGGCASATAGLPGCGVTRTPITGRGPVLVSLRRR